nr:unnamed protein product [Callosobruchus chinensis]
MCSRLELNILNLARHRYSYDDSKLHISGIAHISVAPTTFSILDAVQRRSIRLIDDPALTCHLQPLFHRRSVGDLSPFYRYSNGFCSSELTSIIPPLSKPASRCTRGTSSHPKAVVLHTSRFEWFDRSFVSRVSRARNGLPGDVLIKPVSVVYTLNLTFP